jgi:hypothetical protein
MHLLRTDHCVFRNKYKTEYWSNQGVVSLQHVRLVESGWSNCNVKVQAHLHGVTVEMQRRPCSEWRTRPWMTFLPRPSANKLFGVRSGEYACLCHTSYCHMTKGVASLQGSILHQHLEFAVLWTAPTQAIQNSWPYVVYLTINPTEHQIRYNVPRVKTLTAASKKVAVFWVVALCSLVYFTDVSEVHAASIIRAIVVSTKSTNYWEKQGINLRNAHPLFSRCVTVWYYCINRRSNTVTGKALTEHGPLLVPRSSRLHSLLPQHSFQCYPLSSLPSEWQFSKIIPRRNSICI